MNMSVGYIGGSQYPFLHFVECIYACWKVLRRKMTKFAETGQILRVRGSTSLGTLGQSIAIKVASDLGLTEDFRLLKSEIVASIGGLSAGDGEGLVLGLANGELSVAEIAECLTVDGPDDRNDRLAHEKAMRAVWLIGHFVKDEVTTARLIGSDGGSPVIFKGKPWTFSDPEGWDLFVFNLGAALTTGSSLQVQYSAYGLWVT